MVSFRSARSCDGGVLTRPPKLPFPDTGALPSLLKFALQSSRLLLVTDISNRHHTCRIEISNSKQLRLLATSEVLRQRKISRSRRLATACNLLLKLLSKQNSYRGCFAYVLNPKTVLQFWEKKVSLLLALGPRRM